MNGQLVATNGPDGTTLAVARATSPVRLVRTRFPGTRAAAVCLVTLGAGLLDGDAIAIDLEVEPDATLVVFTQSSTKVFRGASRQTTRAKVAGTLVLLPDPVACFAGARFEQRVEIDLTGRGRCIVLDGFTAGRPAFGERWAMESLATRLVVRRDGRTLVDDALDLDPATMDRFDAYATLLGVGALTEDFLAPPIITRDLVAAPSPLPRASEDGAIVRLAATSPSLVVAEARARLRNLPDIDAVDPFGARS